MSDQSQLLASAPGSCTDIRQELTTLLGLKLTGSTYNSLWKNLELHLGQSGALVFIEKFVDYRTKRKTLEKVMGKRSKTHVMAMMTDERVRLEKQGRTLLKKQSRDRPLPPPKKTRKRIPDHSHVKLPEVSYGRNNLKIPGYAPILQSKGHEAVPLRGRSNWLEKRLENYIQQHWDNLDFGLGEKLSLIDSQVRLSQTQEKVDLLAEAGPVVIPIELKIKQAGGSDLTQLQSYRKDAIKQGHPSENVLGVLVAPQFSSKVLNVVEDMPGIVLRWFELPL